MWVAKPDQGQQCSPDKAKNLEEIAKELEGAKIHVLQSKKGSDGKMRMQMCGAPSGTQNSYLIPRSKLGRALDLGFKEIKK